MKLARAHFTLFLLPTVCLCGFASSQPNSASLSSLPAAAQSTISSALGRDQSSYAVYPARDGFQTSNLNHHFTVSFTSHGVETRNGNLHWRMLPVAYGYGEALSAVPAASPEAQANRIEYRRGSMTEWYANGPLGLEQGFTLSQPPSHPPDSLRPLTVVLALSGNLRATLNPGFDGLTLADNTGDHLRYTGLAAYDADGKELRSWLELRGEQLLLRVDDTSARYPVVIDPFVEDAILTGSDGPMSLGTCVSISGNTIVAGSGFAAYVFVKPPGGGGWATATQTAILAAKDRTPLSQVAVSGNTIVASSFGPSQTGEAFVFIEPSGGWTDGIETAVLTPSDPAAFDLFGVSVAISGNTIAVGAMESDEVGSHYPPTNIGPGAVYVYARPASGWINMTETAKLTAPDGVNGDDLGYSVAIANDTIVAGAPDAVVRGRELAGSAYVFLKPASGWVSTNQAAKLYVSNMPITALSFGYAVAISKNTIVGGAYGGAWVFVEPSTGWVDMSQTATLTDSAALVYPIGTSVAICNGTVVVGAPSLADVFIKPTAGWTDMTQTWRLTSPNRKADGPYGSSLSISGSTITVGFPGTGQPDGNAIYVWGPG